MPRTSDACALQSTLGLKILMAVTGILLFGFVIGHVAGNLLVFAGPEQLNKYAAFLRESKGLLWGTRIVLLAAVAVHIGVSIRLALLKNQARPVAYGFKAPHGSTYAARTMMWSGPIIALFVIYHLLHFTTGTVHPDFKVEDVYANVVIGFRSWPVALAYLIAMGALMLHLSHGLWSMLQTLGINNPRWERCFRRAAIALGILIALGFSSIPLAILFRVIG